MIINTAYHNSVLLGESIDGLNVCQGGIYVDVTYGGGGHSRAILSHLGCTGHLYGFDQDVDALSNVIEADNFTFINHNFRYLKNYLKYYNVESVDGILADLGVSSHQIDDSSRGFTIRDDNALLDMRMDISQSLTASYILNNYDESLLYNILKNYGELKEAKFISRKICLHRMEKSIDRVIDIKDALKGFYKVNDFKFLAKIFQALRIEVNNEMGALKDLLLQSKDLLKSGGRLVVISYHSLEDRPVKNFMRSGFFDADNVSDNISLYSNNNSCFKLISRKAIRPADLEISENNRSRSAKLRICEKL